MLNLTSIAGFILLQGGGGGGGIILLLVIIGLAVGGRIIYSRHIANIAAMEKSVEANIDPSVSGPASALMKRYRDAYLYARVITGIGNLVKNIGVAVGMLLFVIIFLGGSDRTGPLIALLAGIIVGGPIGGFFYIWGILISAAGQLLKASLDCAVNGSPFLTNEHRAKIMSLPAP